MRYKKGEWKCVCRKVRFSGYCHHLYCYFHNVSSDMSSGLLQVFVELENLHRTSNYVFYCNWRLQVQSWLQASNNAGILNTCTRLWLTESEQVTLVDSIKDVVRSSVKVPEFDKHLKKAGGHIGRNVVEITIKMETIVRKPLMIKITKLRLRNLDN